MKQPYFNQYPKAQGRRKMDFTFSIRFGKQPSPDYQSVLAYASKFRMFIPAKEGAHTHVIGTSNHEVMAKFDVFVKLMEAIRDWENTRIVINDAKLKPS